jgi:hypothetical protein
MRVFHISSILFVLLINCSACQAQSTTDEIVITEANWFYSMTFSGINNAEDAKLVCAILSDLFLSTPIFDTVTGKIQLSCKTDITQEQLEEFIISPGLSLTSFLKKDKCKRSNDIPEIQK